MKRIVAASVAGLLFGLGLSISEMTNRHRVLDFLDLGGHWDPTLAFVMGGALLVTVPVFRLVLRRHSPLLADRFYLPERTTVDARLLTGSTLFGVGWGLAGYCPGPALAALQSLSLNPAVFCLFFLLGTRLSAYLLARFEDPRPC